MSDILVENTQKWLNENYKGKTGYHEIEVTGKTGWTTIYALLEALQIELGITATAHNFGNSTTAKFKARFPNGVQQQSASDDTEDNIYGIIQGALLCKGYSTTSSVITKHFYSGTGSAVKELKEDAGCSDTSSTVTLNVMKALMSMDQFKIVYSSGGTENIQKIQQELNYSYEDYIGLCPCDGVYGREMNKAMIKVLQAIEGYSVEDATGNFGSGTKANLPLLPNTGNLSAETELAAKKLVRYALICNGYDVDLALDVGGFGEWDNVMDAAIRAFQTDMCLEVNGKCDVDTWMSLLTSKGNPDRDCVACDTRFEMTESRLEYLKSNGYEIVGRYLTGGDFKELRPNEPQRILDAGLSFFPIFQESSTDVSYFTNQRAIQDAKNATQSAKNFRIPRRSIIYFAVDLDATDSQIKSYVLPYFKNLFECMKDDLYNYYRIGVYGTRNVCTQVMDAGYAETCFVSDMSTGYSGNMGFKMPQNWNFDQFHEFQIITDGETWDLDKDAFSGKFGAVTKLDTPIEKNLYDKLEDLYNLANEYHENNSPNYYVKEKNELVLQYLRSEEYNSDLWNTIAGNIDWDFVNYVYDRVSSSLHPKNVTIYKDNYGNMSIPHLAATVSVIVEKFPIFTDEAIALSGWAGDLIQLGGVIGDTNCTEQDIYNLIGCNDDEFSQNLLGKSAVETGFGFEDLEADIDAVCVSTEICNGVSIHTAFKDYYTTEQYEKRIDKFLGSIGIPTTDRDLVISKLTEFAKEYTNLNKATAILFKDKFAINYNKDKYGDILAEQFAKKIADYGNIE